jgi:tRNA-dihydrouridine synthase A
VVLNGGLASVDASIEGLRRFDGVMIGRAAYQTPWILAEVEAALGAADPDMPSRSGVVEDMAGYARRVADRGVPLRAVARHMLGLFHGCPGARGWRRRLSQNMHRPDAGPELLLDALRTVAPGSGRRVGAARPPASSGVLHRS